MIAALSLVVVALGLFALVCAAGWREAAQRARALEREAVAERHRRRATEAKTNGGPDWRWPSAPPPEADARPRLPPTRS